MAWANLGRNVKKRCLPSPPSRLQSCCFSLQSHLPTALIWINIWQTKWSVTLYLQIPAIFNLPRSFLPETSVPESMLDMILAQEGIAEGGRVYGLTTAVQEFITEDYFRKSTSYFLDPEQQSQTLSGLEKMPDGRVARNAQLFGMEAFARSKLRVLAGDISTLDTSEHNIAAVYSEDDYGTPLMDSHWAKLGDTITLRHVDSWEYVDDVTGEILDPDNLPDDNSFHARAKSYRDISYTVTALVSVPYPLSYRYFGADEFVLGDQSFIEDTHTANVMLYAFNMKNDAATAEMEHFLSSFTQNQDEFDYESKFTYAAEFDGFRSMFLLLGSLLSFIVGLVGILNFFNAILTGIITRRREFAVLQAIGMTGRQLKHMLILEGLLYTLGSLTITLFLSIAGAPLVGSMLSNMFWFFRYRFTIVPILIIFPVFVLLGIALPLISYHLMQKQSVVERIRESD